MIPCHCLIAHPEKPKFLVIRHTDRWSPPALQVPEGGALMYKPAVINQGMMRKYGLRTTVLRIVMEGQNYAVVELELHASSRREMQAVWMGLEEYGQFRKRDESEEDPFENWLKERESGEVPKQRPPWERTGWYKEAEQWVSNKLIELDIQASGSVQQFKAGWPTACLLRVETVQGPVYFKAAYEKPPGEARLTQRLAEIWPAHVPAPLAVDEARNWQLMRDFKIKDENRPAASAYPDFTRTLGALQVDAMERMEEWRDLDCPVMDLDFLNDVDGRAGELFAEVEPLLLEGFKALESEEADQLGEAVERARDNCAALVEFDIPDSLAHLDFRPDNFFVEDEKCMVIDWADVAITHPFIALCRTLDFFEQHGTGEPLREDAEPIDDGLRNAMRDAYLPAFEAILPMERLTRAFSLARSVYPLFTYLYTASQLRLVERSSPQGEIFQNLLKVKARRLIEGAGT